MPTHVLLALAVNLTVAGAALLFGLVSPSGAIGGLVIGLVIFLAAGPSGYALLVAFFVVASGATKLGYARKSHLGVAQESQGRRGAVHAAANCLVPLICAVAWRLSPAYAWKLAYAGALATALADTVSSELGQVFGKTPVLLTSFRKVPVGTEGAVSVEGTFLGLAAAAALALLAVLLGFLNAYAALVPVSVAAIVGSTAESYLARIIRTTGLGNELANLFNTAVGALVAAGLGGLILAR